MRIRDEEKVSLVKQKALESLVEDGFEGFSMNKLAKACGVSVATLYIYYKDKDDLIISVAGEQGAQMQERFMENFHADLSFEEGMRVQWSNRYHFLQENPLAHQFFEQMRNSTYQERFLGNFMKEFKSTITAFMHNVVAKGEIAPMPLEVFWSVAYAPLYALARFDMEGQSLGGKPFKLTEATIWETFELVIKAFKN
jgi:TetR/AcrR family transcriptional repressor of multidrug resistance operon